MFPVISTRWELLTRISEPYQMERPAVDRELSRTVLPRMTAS